MSSSNLHKSLIQKRQLSMPPRPKKASSSQHSSAPSSAMPAPHHRRHTTSSSLSSEKLTSLFSETLPTTNDDGNEQKCPDWSDYFDERGMLENKWRYYISHPTRAKRNTTEHSIDNQTEIKSNQDTLGSNKPTGSTCIDPFTTSTATTSTPTIRPRQHVLVLLHGGGLTSLSWALFVKAFRTIHPAAPVSKHVQIVALDLRDHGQSFDSDNLSMDHFTADVDHILHSLYRDEWKNTSFVLCGHSLGGAIAVHTAHKLQHKCSAVIVLDVVEGTALQALPFMKQVIANRPQKFRNLPDAITWCLSNVTQSVESAHISFPSQLIKDPNHGFYSWRTDLAKSSKYWHEWYQSLSDKFLRVPAPKLLILANKDRLDKALTIGEMQGKFQLKVVYASGHYVHEDNPAQCASSVAQFMSRFLRIGSHNTP